MAKNKKRKDSKKSDKAGAGSAGYSTVQDGVSKVKKRKPEPEHTTSNANEHRSKSSLAQLLKKHRGVAAKTAPPPIWKDKSRQRNFLTPQDDPQGFKDCLQTSYSGFHFDSPDSLPSSLHREFESSFGGMEQGGLFLYDVVQPGKKRLTRTSVTRTLVGDPGSTYKYLGEFDMMLPYFSFSFLISLLLYYSSVS